jgi:SGNH domain (fused to AT3 domains)
MAGGVAVWGSGPASPAQQGPAARAPASGRTRVAVDLAPGLSGSEHAALERSGAYGSHPVHLMILGDSIAMTLGMGLSLGARGSYGVAVADDATAGCDLDPQLEVFTNGAPGPATQGCRDWQHVWPFLVAAERPQVVALGLGRWEVSDHLLDGTWVHVGEPAWDAHLAGRLQSAIAIFHRFGAKVVLFTMPYIDPTDRQPDGAPWSENSSARARAYNALVRHVARADRREVTVIDLNRMLAPNGAYTASVAGVGVRSADRIHVSVPGGVLLQREILPAVDKIGMEDEAAAKAGV